MSAPACPTVSVAGMELLAPSTGADGLLKTPQLCHSDDADKKADGVLHHSPVAPKKTLAAEMRPHAPRGSRRRARTTVAAAPSTSASSAAALLTSAAANHLSGFYVRAVEPRESSYLHYTSLASPGTHTEYHISVSDVIASSSNNNGPSSWVVLRRFSAFLLLRDELLRGLSLSGATPHCSLCGSLREELVALSHELPRKRLWGSSRSSVVRRRAAKFLAFLRALLGLATNAARLRCPVVCFGFAVQVRTFLTRDSEPTGKPAEERGDGSGSIFYYHHPLMGATAVYAMASRGGGLEHAGRSTGGGRSLLELAIREGDAEDEEEEEEEEVKQEEERPAATRRGSYSLASTSTSRRSSTEDASSHTSASTASSSSTATKSRACE